MQRTSLAAISLLMTFGCGPSLPSTPESASSSGAESAVAANASDTEGLAIEASSEVRVVFARMSLPPGERFTAPVSACQDVLVLVRGGSVTLVDSSLPAARGTSSLAEEGSIGRDGALWDGSLGVDDAFRFGPVSGEGLRNDGDVPAELVVAFTRPVGFGFGGQELEEVSESLQSPPEDSACVRPESDGNLPRFVRGAQVPSLRVAGGRLRVRILLDAERNGARYGGLSLLEADADFGVPSHSHPGANEALVIERGEGTMRIGDQRFPVVDGATLFVPDDIEHGLEAAGTTDLRAVQVYAPSGAEQRFRGLAEASAE